MKTTRQRVLDYLYSRPMSSASEISQALHVSAADIRHHLSILLQENAVVQTGLRAAPGKGRPSQLFSPRSQSQLHSLDILAGALLSEGIADIPIEEQATYLQRIAGRILSQSPLPSGHLTRRLVQAIQRLNELHYNARWEAHADAPRIILGNCPFAAILPQHPELCQLDANLMQGLLKSPVHQLKKLAPDRYGAFYCLFTIRPAEPKPV